MGKNHPNVDKYVVSRVRALESLLLEKGLLAPDAVDRVIQRYEADTGPMLGARVVARAWVDPAFKRRLLDDATAALREFDLDYDRLVVTTESLKGDVEERRGFAAALPSAGGCGGHVGAPTFDQIPAALPRRNGELVFEEPWQGRAFGMAVALHEQGLFEWEEFRQELIARIAAVEATGGPFEYYEIWLATFERILTAKGVVSAADVEESTFQFEFGERDEVF